jgi:hypothetical protein
MADARFHRAVPHTYRAIIQQRRRVLAVIAIGIIILWGWRISRATIFELEGLGSEKRKYLKWSLAQSVAPKTKIESVIADDAVAMLSEKLSTPLQFEYYLTRALEEAYKVGQKPVGADMIDNVLAKDINGLEPRLTRQGYNAKVLAELLNAKPREIKSFLSGQLAAGRTQELQSELLAAGIPL